MYPFYLQNMILPSDIEVEDWFISSSFITFHFDWIFIPDKINGPRLNVFFFSIFPSDTLVLYTDESKLDTGNFTVGWALTTAERAIQNNIIYTSWTCLLERMCEVYDAELYAIYEGLTYLSDKEWTEDFLIWVDNQTALQTMHTKNSNHNE